MRALRNGVYEHTTIDLLSRDGVWLLIGITIGAAIIFSAG